MMANGNPIRRSTIIRVEVHEGSPKGSTILLVNRRENSWQKYRELENSIPIQPEVTNLFWESNEQVYARNAEFWSLIKEKNNPLKNR